jgi:hypothetical protein
MYRINNIKRKQLGGFGSPHLLVDRSCSFSDDKVLNSVKGSTDLAGNTSNRLLLLKFANIFFNVKTFRNELPEPWRG